MKIHVRAMMLGVFTAAVIAMSTLAATAQTEKILYSFTGSSDGGSPEGGVVVDAKGNLYGTAFSGGANGGGAVFELSPSGGGVWTEKAIYSFSFGSSEGALPASGLVFDTQGNLYGMTIAGGSGYGTVFELSPSGASWTEKTLYTFAGGTDGSVAFATGLAMDRAGDLYGVTDIGGTYGFGTVFELVAGSNGTWTKKTLHSFSGGNDGASPYGERPVLDSSGDVFGQVQSGGPHDFGLIFEMVPGSNGSWSEKIVHAFAGASDGSSSYGLTFDAAGNLFGNSTYSTIEVTPGSNGVWTEKILHTFIGGSDGAYPNTALTFDKSGILYGATNSGGNHRGTVFSLTPASNGTWTEKILHRFAPGGGDGIYPFYGALALDAQGNLYGTTSEGGSSNQGVVYEITP